ncbi:MULTISPECIES: hypothetical protein [unclassified Bradyrhizobium]|uniref:hypothetical protein n=2 Tax=Bradyrhizobium TaxID=374 RepID=UPI002FF17EF9
MTTEYEEPISRRVAPDLLSTVEIITQAVPGRALLFGCGDDHRPDEGGDDSEDEQLSTTTGLRYLAGLRIIFR